MKDYDIAHRTGVCCVSGRELEPEEEFFAVLFETPEGFERRDHALDIWQGPPQGYFCYWKSYIPKKEEKKRLFVDKGILFNLLDRLQDSEEEVKQHFRFVLALILMRKRLLKYEQTLHEDGREIWEMRVTGEQTRYRIENPRLNDGQIEAVSKELGIILQGDTEAFADMAGEPTGTTDTTQSAQQETPGEDSAAP